MAATAKTEHGVSVGFFSNLPEPHPVLECLCGYMTGINDTWEQCGQEIDDHLREVASADRS